MKFSATTLLVILPLLAAQASALAVPESGFARRAGNAKDGQGSFGGKGGKGAAAGVAAGAAAKGKGGAAANSTSSAAGSAATAAASNATTANGAAANATGGGGGGDPQTSLTLDPSVICSNFKQDGNETPTPGQSPSLTSQNNFINFCVGQTLTNGLQIQKGSCNPAPIGMIPPTTQMPTAKFQFPVNMANIAPNTAFTVKMAVSGFETGSFANAEKSYFAAPQQLNAQQQIIGHSHVVIQLMDSITQTTTLDPTKFSFFQGLNSPAVDGVLTADVTNGLPAGAYKISSINTAGNHQPAVVAVAQHGSLDDTVYFTVGGSGAGASNATAGAAAASSTDAAAAASTSAAAGGKGAAAASSAAAAATGAAKGNAGGKGANAGGSQGGAKGGQGKQGRRFIREAY